MHFKLVYGNHWNFGLQVSDTFRYLKLALESAGHRADIEKEPVSGFVNIFQECFDTEYTEKLQKAYDGGLQFIILATEFLTGFSFNRFDENEQGASYYSKRDYWQQRCDNFFELSSKALCVWHLCEQEIDGYQHACSGTPVGYLPHAYVDGFQSVVTRPTVEKDIDFLFTGTLTDYRLSVLHELENLGHKVVYSHALTAPFHRDDLVARSKISLNLKQYQKWRYPSPSRYFFHLSNASYVISEASEYACDIQKYIDTCREPDLVDYCQRILRDKKFDERAGENLARFRQESSAALAVENLLDSTLFTSKRFKASLLGSADEAMSPEAMSPKARSPKAKPYKSEHHESRSIASTSSSRMFENSHLNNQRPLQEDSISLAQVEHNSSHKD